MLCRYVMDFHIVVLEKSWKVIVEKEWAPCNAEIQVVLFNTLLDLFCSVFGA